ncbi:MAG: CpaF family protein [Rickettsiales bacterium]
MQQAAQLQDLSNFMEQPAATFSPSSAHGPNTKMPNLGLLNRFIEDDSIQEIMVNGLHSIYIDQQGTIVDAGSRFSSHEELYEVANAIMNSVGQHWEKDRPMLDTRLPDGSRVNLVGLPMALDGISMSIRKFPKHKFTLERMAELGQLTPELVVFLKHLIGARLNTVVAGGTSSGKTTVMNALSAAIGINERIVTIEDSAELRLQQPHVVRLEAKQAMSMDAMHTAVTIRDLVKNALRMRPDRIIVGESRGPEAFDVLQAMNTGHDGSMTTLHANTPRDALSRLETMVTLAVPLMPIRLIRSQIASALHILIQMNRTKDGQRRMTHISEIGGMEGETIIMQDLIMYQEAAGGQPAGYRWMAGSSRNAVVTEAARAAGYMRGIR